MQARYKVAFVGSAAPTFYVDKELKLESGDAILWKQYYETQLKQLFLNRRIAYAYIVTDTTSRDRHYTVDSDRGSFWKEFLGEGQLRVRGLVPVEVRRLEFNPTTQEIYCTDPYYKDFNRLIDNWPKMGMRALDPPGDPGY